MTKDPALIQSPSFARFILWEILGIVGFFISSNMPRPMIPRPVTLANTVVFIALYPILYFYNQLRIPLVLKFIIYPLSMGLGLVLMVSAFLWITYVAYATGFSWAPPPASRW